MAGNKASSFSNHVISAGSLTTGTPVQTKPWTIDQLDNLSFQVNWASGSSLAATCDLQGSDDYNDINGNVTNPGTWNSIPLTPANPPLSGTSGSLLIQAVMLCCRAVRLVITASAGTATVDVYLAGKAI